MELAQSLALEDPGNESCCYLWSTACAGTGNRDSGTWSLPLEVYSPEEKKQMDRWWQRRVQGLCTTGAETQSAGEHRRKPNPGWGQKHCGASPRGGGIWIHQTEHASKAFVFRPPGFSLQLRREFCEIRGFLLPLWWDYYSSGGNTCIIIGCFKMQLSASKLLLLSLLHGQVHEKLRTPLSLGLGSWTQWSNWTWTQAFLPDSQRPPEPESLKGEKKGLSVAMWWFVRGEAAAGVGLMISPGNQIQSLLLRSPVNVSQILPPGGAVMPLLCRLSKEARNSQLPILSPQDLFFIKCAWKILHLYNLL